MSIETRWKNFSVSQLYTAAQSFIYMSQHQISLYIHRVPQLHLAICFKLKMSLACIGFFSYVYLFFHHKTSLCFGVSVSSFFFVVFNVEIIIKLKREREKNSKAKIFRSSLWRQIDWHVKILKRVPLCVYIKSYYHMCL